MNKHAPDFPMMMSYEVRALENILMALPQLTFVEWGSGRSTLYFTRLLSQKNIPYVWVSVEHNKEWHEYVQQKLGNNPHVHLLYVPKEDSADYVSAPQKALEKLGISHVNVSLVDGIHRNECVSMAHTFSDIVLLHDAQRKSYNKRGRYLAGRLFKFEERDNLFSRLHILAYQLHEKLWKLKERLTLQ